MNAPRTPPNSRILKAGLRRAALLAINLPVPGGRRAVRAAVNAALPGSAQVADVVGTPRDLRGTSTKGPLRHYADVLGATIGFLHGDYLSGELGSTGATAFLWSMPTLFQEALRGVIAESTSLRLLDDVPVATIHDARGVKRSSSKVNPDCVALTATGSTLLPDAKYKHAANSSLTGDLIAEPGARTIRVPRSDIYQMAAYRQHDRWADPAGALVYPIKPPPRGTASSALSGARLRVAHPHLLHRRRTKRAAEPSTLPRLHAGSGRRKRRRESRTGPLSGRRPHVSGRPPDDACSTLREEPLGERQSHGARTHSGLR